LRPDGCTEGYIFHVHVDLQDSYGALIQNWILIHTYQHLEIVKTLLPAGMDEGSYPTHKIHRNS